MASNEEIISSAIEEALNTDNTVDLLLISDTLDTINGETVSSDKDYGMHYSYLYVGMSGQKMVDKMNENWKATDAQFLAHNNALQLRIISNQIKEIKEEDGIISYTTDGETWNSLISTWGKIQGDITKQADLQNLLLEKVDVSTFESFKGDVEVVTNATIVLQSDVGQLQDSVSNILSTLNGASGVLVRLDVLESLIQTKISSENVLQIRENESAALEYTKDGEVWNPVSTAGIVNWGDILGNIEDQADLQQKLILSDGKAQSALDGVEEVRDELNESINQHINNKSNPHEVTKDQIGIHLYTLEQYSADTKTMSDFYIVDDTFYNPSKYTLIFDFNGGTFNSLETYNYSHGDDTTILLSNVIGVTPVYEGHTFLGFSENETASSATYTLDDSITLPNNDSTLYAVWITN